MSFYCNAGSFFKAVFLCVSTWSSNHLSCRRDTAEWRMFDLRSLWFTPVLPPDVCLLSVFLDTPVSHHEPLMEIFLSVVYFTVFNSAEHPIQWKPVLFLSDQSNPSSSPSHVDNVPYYWTWFLFVLRFFVAVWARASLIKTLRTVARCYVKHCEPEPPSLLPSSWPFSVLTEH